MIAYCGCVVSRANFTVPSAAARAEVKPRVEIPVLRRGDAVAFQDATYGKGMRVHNPLKRKPKEGQRGRCSVCGTIRDIAD
jgi:hypothetical protein